jgi:PqqD family protein of HPr-rel-A system
VDRSPRWRIVEACIEDVAHFDDGSLVLNSLSWETHLLNPDATLALELLREGPHTEGELLDELLSDEGDFGEQERAQYARQLRASLTDLETFGLIAASDAEDR